ncbi:MAG: hypothetical protein J6N51_15695 [Selenomonas sp.]|nr:hypothetical protein [Selenomonas sp.]
MKQAKIELSNEMADFINNRKIDDLTEFKRAAFMLYAYIDAGLISHGKAASMLGVDKFRLINFYGKYGLQYITDPVDKYADSEKKLLSYYESKEK